MRVKFIDVGRDKKSWEAETDGELTYSWLFGQVKKRGSLLSSGIDFYEDGSITSVFRTVGRYEII